MAINNDTNGKLNQALKESISTPGQPGLVILNADGTNVGGSGGTSSTYGSAFPSTGTAAGFKDSTGTNMAPGNLDSSGFLKVNVAAGGGAGGTSSTYSSAFPSTGTAVGFKDSTGTNMVPANLDASGFLKVNVAAGGGAGGTSSTYGVAFPATGTAAGFTDGVNMRAAYVAPFHNSDNQAPSSNQYGLLAGGVAQILNPSGNLDRQRGTGFDGVSGVGIATGTQQLATAPFTTTFNGSVTANAVAQTITLTTTTNLVVGDMVITQDNVEYAEVLTIPSGTTITAILKNNHASGQTVKWFHYNQARDALGSADNTTGTGISPSATYLYNNNTALFEYDRSALGELDGASGKGTAVAAEYEYNGQPLGFGNALSSANFDRARNVQAGGLGAGTVANNPLAANSTTLTLNVTPTTLQPGAQIIFDRAGTSETNYVGTSYTAGSTTVPLQIATLSSHAQNSTVEWSQHASLGPQLNGFLPSGLGMEEEIVYDPLSKKYFVEIAATADANSGQNIVLENAALFNGATFDRERGVIGDAQTAAGIGADTIMLYNGTTYDRLKDTLVVGAANVALAAALPAGTAIVGKVTTDQTTHGTTDLVAADITKINGTTPVTSIAGSLGFGGDTAAAATDAGNPLKIGGVGRLTLPTAVTDGQRTNAIFDKVGRQIVVTGTVRDLKADAPLTLAASVVETTLIPAIASTFCDITGITVNNTSATACRVDFRDTTAGAIRFSIQVPVGDIRGFSNLFYKQTTVNTNWTAQCSVSVTDIRISATYEKNI